MGVKVAEYLGQRTDIDTPVIQPATKGAACPFMNDSCAKLNKNQQPVCSVRKNDGTLWIVCQHRFCATKKTVPLSIYQISTLHSIAQTLFDPTIDLKDVSVKREEKLQVYAGKEYNADYIMTVFNGTSPYPGPDRLVLEMQGGGETNSTKKITDHVTKWANNPNRTNAELRTEVSANTLETNAWRRQQEQFIVKGNIAMKTWKGYGMALCVGSLLYDYLMNKLSEANLPDLRDYNWNLALVGIIENKDETLTSGPIPLKIDEGRLLFTNYQTFVQALINQGDPTLDAFAGTFTALDGSQKYIPRNGRGTNLFVP